MSKSKTIIASMQNIWSKYFPDFVFEYSFLDQSIANYYKQEAQLSILYKIFSCIAIFYFLSWFIRVGLVYGYTTQKRNRRTQSVGRTGSCYCYHVIKGVYHSHYYRFFNCNSGCLVFYAPVVTTICVSHNTWYWFFCCYYYMLFNNCLVNCRIYSNQSSHSQSCKEFENGVKKLRITNPARSTSHSQPLIAHLAKETS